MLCSTGTGTAAGSSSTAVRSSGSLFLSTVHTILDLLASIIVQLYEYCVLATVLVSEAEDSKNQKYCLKPQR